MGLKTVFTIGFELPKSAGFEYKSFDSMSSLLDADIILFEPTMIYKTDYPETHVQGKPNLTDSSSLSCKQSLEHWRGELKTAFEAGKTILLYLRQPEEVYINTGNTLSGSGRSITTVRNLSQIDSHLALPIKFKDKKIANGKNIKITQDGNFLKTYWNTVKDISSYELYFDVEKAKPLIRTASGDKTVGVLLSSVNSGNIIVLPPLNIPDRFTAIHSDGKTNIWTEDARKFGKALFSQIIAVDKHLKYNTEQTPPPDWIHDKQFRLEEEEKHLDEIAKIETQILKLQEKIEDKKDALNKASIAKGLLFEGGKALEYAIIDALKTIGFKAENYDDGKSEFDIVFESAEGRFIGEAEGKDASAINIQKLQQLERNINEDFARDEIAEHAKGILFGNPHRLTHPKDRKECFTDKVMQSAKRTGIALVNTHELFEVVKYLKKTKDKTYAKKVRECFRATKGEIIRFPNTDN